MVQPPRYTPPSSAPRSVPRPVEPPSRGGVSFALVIVLAMVAAAGTIGYSLGHFRAQPVLVSSGSPSCPPPPACLIDGDVLPPAPSSSASLLPVPTTKADDLVKASVGRWKSADGRVTVEVDPVKAQPGKAPPYRLVVRSPDLPRSGYGCEFAQGDERHGPGEMVYYRAWCERGKRALLGLDITGEITDPVLLLVVLQDGELHLRTSGRRAPATY